MFASLLLYGYSYLAMAGLVHKTMVSFCWGKIPDMGQYPGRNRKKGE
jgi:hypothetical protein